MTEGGKLMLGGIFAAALAAGGGYLVKDAMGTRADWAPERFELWQGAALTVPAPAGLERQELRGDQSEGVEVWGDSEPPFQRVAWARGHEPSEFEDLLAKDLAKTGLPMSDAEHLQVAGNPARHRVIDLLNLHMTTWRCEGSGRAMLLIVRAGPETDPGAVAAWNRRVLDGLRCD